MKATILTILAITAGIFSYSQLHTQEPKPTEHKFLAFPDNTKLYNSTTFNEAVGVLDEAIIVTETDISNGYIRITSETSNSYVRIEEISFAPIGKKTRKYLKKWEESLKSTGYSSGYWRVLNTKHGGHDIYLKLHDLQSQSSESLVYNVKEKNKIDLVRSYIQD